LCPEVNVPALNNDRWERFAQGLAKGMPASEAYVSAGYVRNDGNASRLKGNEKVAARVEEIRNAGALRAEVSIQRVLQELGRIGFADLRQAFDGDGNLKPVAEWGDDLAAAVASVEVVSRSLPGVADEDQEPQGHGGTLKRNRGAAVEYVHKIRFWDKNSALEKIAKHLGMFVEKVELAGAVEHRHRTLSDFYGDAESGSS
jgi:phage terminase small subunit